MGFYISGVVYLLEIIPLCFSNLIHAISKFYKYSKTNLPLKGIENTIELFNEDCTIPFISRYRKEQTGNLDEVEIGKILEFKKIFEELGKRKLSILKSLEEQEVLTDELKISNSIQQPI